MKKKKWSIDEYIKKQNRDEEIVCIGATIYLIAIVGYLITTVLF